MEKIIYEVKKEFDYARENWSEEFDDKNTVNDWIAFITGYAGHAYDHARSSRGKTPDMEAIREDLMKVAVIALGAIQAFDRNEGFPPRHYD